MMVWAYRRGRYYYDGTGVSSYYYDGAGVSSGEVLL